MKMLIFATTTIKNIKYNVLVYNDVLSNDRGNKLLMEFDLYISPDSPMKQISIGVSCLNSYSAIDCRHAPHGGIGDKVGLESDAAVIANFTILAFE